MTNKTMLSVERELLEELRNVCGDPDLAAEANAILNNPAAKHQGEPVAYTTAGMLEIAKRLPLTGRIGAKATKDERWNIPLFLSQDEQPAPVAVVMPEFESAFEAWWESDGQYCRAGGGSYEKTFAYRAYEAALAEVTRLNTPQ